MYDNIGKKIKGLAKAIFIIEVIAIVFIGIGGMASSLGGGLLFLFVLGPIAAVLAWMSTWLVYGFGELIDKVSDVELNTRSIATNVQSKPDAEIISKLDSLLDKSLTTEEECQENIQVEQ